MIHFTAIFTGVSTHAPLRGATPPRRIESHSERQVSTHAPLRGATQGILFRTQPQKRFNPRTPAGCDLTFRSINCSFARFQPTHPCGVRQEAVLGEARARGVSTHAPLRGATPRLTKHTTGHRRFQPTHPCGVRLRVRVSLTCSLVFQPTHPCGVRQLGYYTNFWINNVSTHAPLRGATLRAVGMFQKVDVSTHAPLRGATLVHLR